MTDDTDPSRRLELIDDLSVLDREIWWRGCSILTVEARGPGRPSFAATLGLAHIYDHPELVVVGASRELSVAILAGLSDEVRVDEARYGPWSRPSLEGVRFDLIEVLPAHFEHLLDFWVDYGRARSPAALDCGALQVVVPDRYFCACHARRKYWLDDPRPLVARPRSKQQRHPRAS